MTQGYGAIIRWYKWRLFCSTCPKYNSGFVCSFSGAAKVSCTWSSASAKMAAISWARTALRLTPSLKWSTITPHINSPSKELNTCPCSSLCWFRLSDWSEHCSENKRQRYMPLGMNIQQIRHTNLWLPHVLIVQSIWLRTQTFTLDTSNPFTVRSVHMPFHILVNNSFQSHQINLMWTVPDWWRRDLLLVFSRLSVLFSTGMVNLPLLMFIDRLVAS